MVEGFSFWDHSAMGDSLHRYPKWGYPFDIYIYATLFAFVFLIQPFVSLLHMPRVFSIGTDRGTIAAQKTGKEKKRK